MVALVFSAVNAGSSLTIKCRNKSMRQASHHSTLVSQRKSSLRPNLSRTCEASGQPRPSSCSASASNDKAAEQPLNFRKPWRLGASPFEVLPMGISTYGWGDRELGYGETYHQEDLCMTFEDSISNGISLFDTAEIYGYQGIPFGQSAEQLLGKLAHPWRARHKLVLSTKYIPLQWMNVVMGGGVRLGAAEMVEALKASAKRAGVQSFELVHVGMPIGDQKVLSAGLQQAYEMGLAKAVGVCNYTPSQLMEAHRLLSKAGVPLATCQMQYSLLNRSAESSGMLKTCVALGVTPLAYSPLAGGALTNDQHQDHDTRMAVKFLGLIGTLGYKGATPAQLALNYLIANGAIPLVGCTTAAELEEAAGALNFQLQQEDLDMLDEKFTYIEQQKSQGPKAVTI